MTRKSAASQSAAQSASLSSIPGKRILKLASCVAVATVVLAGCSTAPLSVLDDGKVYHPAVLNRFPVFVVAIDGSSTAFRPAPISPGTHSVRFAAVPVAGFRFPVEKTYTMDIAPCTGYYVAAQRRSPVLQDWELVVEDTYPVGGCNPARELEKAKTAAVSNATPGATSHANSDARAESSSLIESKPSSPALAHSMSQ